MYLQNDIFMEDKMKYNFVNLSNDILKGMKEFSLFHGFEISQDGISINIEINLSKNIVIYRNGESINVKLPSEGYIFRAMTHILSNKESAYIYEEPVKFSTVGAMFDVSQGNSLLNIDTCKLMLKMMAGMGFNMFMLYLEDCYAIDGEPYFGYMRPKYTQSELKELDDYAYILGIEMIPCIQTLGHLKDALKRYYPYSSFTEDETTLLVGDERTYSLIEKMIKTASKPFRSKRIHVGLDEAFFLGQGRYLMQNGYRQKSDIMYEHLERVYEIATNNGLRPMMWFDMFFRSKSKTNNLYDDNVYFSEKDKLDRFPALQPVYWDYYHTDEKIYEHMLKEHKEITDKVIFAGGVWTWAGLLPDIFHTFNTTNVSLKVCKEKGIKDVYATCWGDDGCETDMMFSLVGAVLYGEHSYNKEIDNKKLCEELKLLFNTSKETMLDISKALYPLGKYTHGKSVLSIKQIIYSDLLIGLCDFDMQDKKLPEYYNNLYNFYLKESGKDGYYKEHFKYVASLCKTAMDKVNIVHLLRTSYKNNDKDTLNKIINKLLPQLKEDYKELKEIHFKLWHGTNKPFGFEIIDLRYSGKIGRIDTTVSRLQSFINGEVATIEELEEERLPHNNCHYLANWHTGISSAYMTVGY